MWRYYEKINNIIFSLGDNTARYDTFSICKNTITTDGS